MDEFARLRLPPPAELPGRDSTKIPSSVITELARERDKASPSSPDTLKVPENFRNVPAPSPAAPPSEPTDRWVVKGAGDGEDATAAAAAAITAESIPAPQLVTDGGSFLIAARSLCHI